MQIGAPIELGGLLVFGAEKKTLVDGGSRGQIIPRSFELPGPVLVGGNVMLRRWPRRTGKVGSSHVWRLRMWLVRHAVDFVKWHLGILYSPEEPRRILTWSK